MVRSVTYTADEIFDEYEVQVWCPRESRNEEGRWSTIDAPRTLDDARKLAAEKARLGIPARVLAIIRVPAYPVDV